MSIIKIPKCDELVLDSNNLLPSSREVNCSLNVSSYDKETSENYYVGIWECSTGYFQRQVVDAEYSYIISGKCTFTNDKGEEITLSAGDTVFFPKNTTGEWHIIEKLKKSYIIFR